MSICFGEFELRVTYKDKYFTSHAVPVYYTGLIVLLWKREYDLI